jgi:hypothetical protein
MPTAAQLQARFDKAVIGDVLYWGARGVKHKAIAADCGMTVGDVAAILATPGLGTVPATYMPTIEEIEAEREKLRRKHIRDKLTERGPSHEPKGQPKEAHVRGQRGRLGARMV